MLCLFLLSIGNWPNPYPYIYLPVHSELSMSFFFSYVFWGMKGIFILFGFLVWRKQLLSSIWPKKIIFYFGETCIYVAANTIIVSVLSTRLPRYLVPEGLTHFFLGLYKCILLRTGLLEQLISLCNLSYLNVHDTLTSAKKCSMICSLSGRP